MEDKIKETLVKNFDNYIKMLENDDFEKALIKELNERIDIPVINEKTEKKILKGIYRAVLTALSKIDPEKL